jgi:hypothetical protein
MLIRVAPFLLGSLFRQLELGASWSSASKFREYMNSPRGSRGGSRMLRSASRLGGGSVSVEVSGVGGVAVSAASLAAKGFVSRSHVLVQTRHGCLLGPSTAEMRRSLQHGQVLVSLVVCLVSVRFKWLQPPHNPPGVRMKSVPSQLPGHVTWAHRIVCT